MALLDENGLRYLWTQLKAKFAAKSHTHDDRYYTESEMNTKLAAKSDSGHNHDSRYYTESEMDGKLKDKAESIVLASNADLNTITTPGIYSCGGGNTLTNKPSGLDAIGMVVVHNASGAYYTQILTTSSNANTYRRTCMSGTWSDWTIDRYTDTNTWRGIQNNLTSDSTTDSLSAAQGKALKALVDEKAASSHTHKSVIDNGNGTSAITFAYSKSGMNYADYTWIAAWNGYELRAVNKNQFAQASHTHAYLPLAGGTVTGATAFTNTTASTNKSTGAVKISGGMGVAGRMSANEVMIGDGCTLMYNTTNKCVDFVFS